MVGFGVFGQACGPSVTSGILSAVVQVDNTPVMLQTTCAVHGGSSGGPLFSTHSGDLLGNQPLGPPQPSPYQDLVPPSVQCKESPLAGEMVRLRPRVSDWRFQAALPQWVEREEAELQALMCEIQELEQSKAHKFFSAQRSGGK